MKACIYYFSLTGNTKLAAEYFAQVLEEKRINAELFEIKAKEQDNFFSKATKAFLSKETDIESVGFDLGSGDIFVLATPIWAANIPSAVRTFIGQLPALAGKKTIIITTSNFNLGRRHCRKALRSVFKEKGADIVSEFSLRQKQLLSAQEIKEVFRKQLPRL